MQKIFKALYDTIRAYLNTLRCLQLKSIEKLKKFQLTYFQLSLFQVTKMLHKRIFFPCKTNPLINETIVGSLIYSDTNKVNLVSIHFDVDFCLYGTTAKQQLSNMAPCPSKVSSCALQVSTSNSFMVVIHRTVKYNNVHKSPFFHSCHWLHLVIGLGIVLVPAQCDHSFMLDTRFVQVMLPNLLFQ